jgi:peptidoglycan/xylan/chitin deacetylase (PgdA/CDA1 family)
VGNGKAPGCGGLDFVTGRVKPSARGECRPLLRIRHESPRLVSHRDPANVQLFRRADVAIASTTVRAAVRAAVFRLLRLTMLPLLIRETIQRSRVTVIYYHDPSPPTLSTHLALLGRTYNIISLRTFLEAHRHGTMDSLPVKPLVVCLDDGHAGNFRLKGLLEGTQVPITIFLCSGIVGTGRRFWFKHVSGDVESLKLVPDSARLERLGKQSFDQAGEFAEREALSHAEVEELSSLVDFESHTISHPILPLCPDAKAAEEIIGSKQALEDEYGFEIRALAYPNGDYSEREISFARRAGYEYALTADVGFNRGRTDPFRLKRIGIDDHDGIDELLVKACGLWGWINLALRPKRFGYRAVSNLATQGRTDDVGKAGSAASRSS